MGEDRTLLVLQAILSAWVSLRTLILVGAVQAVILRSLGRSKPRERRLLAKTVVASLAVSWLATGVIATAWLARAGAGVLAEVERTGEIPFVLFGWVSVPALCAGVLVASAVSAYVLRRAAQHGSEREGGSPTSASS